MSNPNQDHRKSNNDPRWNLKRSKMIAPGTGRSIDAIRNTKRGLFDNQKNATSVNPRRPWARTLKQQQVFQSVQDIWNQFGSKTVENLNPNISPNLSPNSSFNASFNNNNNDTGKNNSRRYLSPNLSPIHSQSPSPNPSPYPSPEASPNPSQEASSYSSPEASSDSNFDTNSEGSNVDEDFVDDDLDDENLADEDISTLLSIQDETFTNIDLVTNEDRLKMDQVRFKEIQHLENNFQNFTRFADSLWEEIFARFDIGLCLWLYQNYKETFPVIQRTILRRRNTVIWNKELSKIIKQNGLSKHQFFKLIGQYINNFQMIQKSSSNELDFMETIGHLPVIESIRLGEPHLWELLFLNTRRFGSRLERLNDTLDLYLRSKLFTLLLPRVLGNFTKLKQFRLDCSIEVLNQCAANLLNLSTIKFYIVNTENVEQFARFAQLYRNQIETLELIVYMHCANPQPWLLFDSISNLTNLNKLSVQFVMERTQQEPELIKKWNDGFDRNIDGKLPKTITMFSLQFLLPAIADDNQNQEVLCCNNFLNQFLRNLPNLKLMKFCLNQPNSQELLRFASAPNPAPNVVSLTLELDEVLNLKEGSSTSSAAAHLQHCDFSDSVRVLHLKNLLTSQFLSSCFHFKQLTTLRLNFDRTSKELLDEAEFDQQLVNVVTSLSRLQTLIVEGFPCTASSFTNTIGALSTQAKLKSPTLFTLRLSWTLVNGQLARNPACRLAPNNLHIY